MKSFAAKRHHVNQGPGGLATYVVAVLSLVLLLDLLIGFDLGFTLSRVFITGSIFLLGIIGLYKNGSAAKHKAESWHDLVKSTSLDYQVGGPFLGYPVYLEGFYRGRFVLLHNNSDKGIFQLPATRIEMNVENIGNASLRMRGPYPSPKSEADNDVVADMFKAARLKQIGQERRFFVGASQIHLTTNLLSIDTVQAYMKRLRQPVNIVLDRKKIYFEHPGHLYDAEYLCFLLDLVTELANSIERTANTRLMLAAATHSA